MLSVGLTGNLASGKSTVARVWREAGIPVISADDLSREVVGRGSPGLDEVRRAFGDEVLGTDGALDRDRMRDLIFRDADARRRLEGILHPRIAARREKWLDARRREGCALVVTEIPLLFEAGLEESVDVTVLVHAPLEERMRRAQADRNLRPDEARRIMAAQGDPEEKKGRADFVLENDGTPAELEERALALLSELESRAGGSPVRRPSDGATPGRVRLDLHLHTWGSWDSTSDPARVLARARERGLDRIAITDHNCLDVALEWAAKEPDRVIPGEEVKTREGVDVIGLYLSTVIPRGTPARETCLEIRRQGGIVYLPHPFARGKGGSGRLAPELAPLLDVVEVFNARLLSSARNRMGLEFAVRHDLLQGAGSDAHTVGEVGNAWVEVPSHRNRPEALLHALQNASVGGRRASVLAFARSNFAKVRKRIWSSA